MQPEELVKPSVQETEVPVKASVLQPEDLVKASVLQPEVPVKASVLQPEAPAENPELKLAFARVFKKIQELSEMDFSRLSSLKQEATESYINNMKAKLEKLSPPQYHARLKEEFFGLGPVEPLMQNADISEIIINGKDQIFYEQKTCLHLLPDTFLSQLTFHNFIHRILESADMVLSLKKPFVDGNWRGWRVHVIRQPVVQTDFHLSFRRHPRNPWSFSRLKDQRWAPEKAIKLIEKLLQEKTNILIAGPTSSGKTSVLNACLQCLPPKERVITIEDSSELILPNAFSTKLLTRENSNSPSTLLNIDQSELVRQSLRMRPDRIIMGETRGTEAKDLLMALATGHSGSLGTIHAKDHKQALWRLEMLVQMGAPSWDTYTIRQMIVLSIEYLIVLGKYNGERKLMGVYQLSGVEKTGFLFEALYTHLSNPESFFIS